MKIAICNELYQDWSFEQAFGHARRMGYQGLEIAPFTLHPDARKISRQMRAKVKQLAEDSDLEIVGLHWLLAKTSGYHATHPDRAVRQKTASYLCELARLCRDLGGRLMVFGSPQQRNLLDGVSFDQGFEYFVACLQEICPVLDECQVTLALEPLGPDEGNFMLTAESAIEIARAVNSPWVRLHLDVKAMSTESKPIPQIIQDSSSWLVHVHANDPNRQGPGMGSVDFIPIVTALEEMGYDGWLSVEVFDFDRGVDVLAGDSIRYLQQVLRPSQVEIQQRDP
jgi:sugar phosphate isomerase/epimerase